LQALHAAPRRLRARRPRPLDLGASHPTREGASLLPHLPQPPPPRVTCADWSWSGTPSMMVDESKWGGQSRVISVSSLGPPCARRPPELLHIRDFPERWRTRGDHEFLIAWNSNHARHPRDRTILVTDHEPPLDRSCPSPGRERGKSPGRTGRGRVLPGPPEKRDLFLAGFAVDPRSSGLRGRTRASPIHPHSPTAGHRRKGRLPSTDSATPPRSLGTHAVGNVAGPS